MVETESSNEVSISGNNPFTIIHNNDEIRNSIITVKLNGVNYLAWFKSIKVGHRTKKS